MKLLVLLVYDDFSLFWAGGSSHILISDEMNDRIIGRWQIRGKLVADLVLHTTVSGSIVLRIHINIHPHEDSSICICKWVS